MTPFDRDVATALEACFPPRISGESDVDYQQRARAVVAERVAAAARAVIDDLEACDEGIDAQRVFLAALRGAP